MIKRILHASTLFLALGAAAFATAQNVGSANARFMGYKNVAKGTTCGAADPFGTMVRCTDSTAQMFLIQANSFLYTVQDTDDAKAPLVKAFSHRSGISRLAPGTPLTVRVSGRDLFVMDEGGSSKGHRFRIASVEPVPTGN